MSDTGFFIGFFVILIILAIATAGNGGIFSNMASSTPVTTTQIGGDGTTIQSPDDTDMGSGGGTTETPPPPPPEPKLSPEEIERKVAEIYRELDRLGKELRAQKLREPVSPYAGLVDLRSGNSRDTDPEREYLTIRAEYGNTNPITISDWYLESYVTEERAALPQGDRIMDRWRHPVKENILLDPGEEAYVMTGESPIDVSFREHMCTGYLEYTKDFYPSLSYQCPSPLTEMERFADIDLDDDSCYDFVERLSQCVEPNEDAVDDADLSGVCRRFITNTLNYEDCVIKHRNDPFFDNVGYWHIYLEEDEELWRYEREIIRLMDENDKVIDVVEY